MTVHDGISDVNEDAFCDGGTSPPVDLDAAQAFFARRFGGETTGYAAFGFLRDGAPSHVFVPLATATNGVSLSALPDGVNAYLAVATYRTDENRTEANILHLNALYCEEDATQLPDTLPKPSYRVETSAGRFQSYWELATPVDVATARKYIAAIAGVVDVNDAKDAARLLRLPGTINHKAGRERFRVRFVEGSGKVYNLADFAHLLTPAATMPTNATERAQDARIHEGGRNNTLMRTAGLLQRQGFDDAAIDAALLAENTAKCDPPLPDHEVLKIARSVERYKKGTPIGGSVIPATVDANGYETFGPADLRNLPPLPFLVDGVIPLHGLGEIVGPPGSGKSFYTVHIAADVASRNHDPKNVLYVAAEGFFGMGQRTTAWESEYRTLPEERFRCIKVAPKLLLREDVDKVIATARREHSQVIILDTLARTMGGDENSTKDMTAYTDACGRISEACDDALVLVVHHFGWNGDRQRGNSSLLGAVDVEIQVTRVDGDVTVKVTKGKDFQDGGTRHFTTKTIQLESGASSLVLVPSDGVGAMMRAMSRYQQYLDVLETFGEKGTTSTEWLNKIGAPKTTFDRARRYLLDTKDIVKEGSLYKVNREKRTTSTT